MSYDAERALVTRIAEEKSFAVVAKLRVTGALFLDTDTRDAFEWIAARYARFGKVPSLHLVKEHFPDFREEQADDETELIVDTLQAKKLYADLQAAVKRITTEARMDPREGLATLKEEAANIALAFNETNDVDLLQSADAVRKKYKELKRRKGLLGLPWPWEYVTRKTRGIRKGLFYVFYANPGSYKTWILIYIADFLHREHDAKPLFISPEMSREDVMFRWAAMRSGADYGTFQDGRLTPKEERGFNRALDLWHEEQPFIVSEMEEGTVVEIEAKAKEYGCDIILIDSFAYLAPDFDWKYWGKTVQGLKRMARRTKIPVIGTHHTNQQRGGRKRVQGKHGDAKDVAMGDMLIRWVDALISLQQTEELEELEQVEMIFKKMREGKLPIRCRINAKVPHDFSLFSADGEGGVTYGNDEDEDGE